MDPFQLAGLVTGCSAVLVLLVTVGSSFLEPSAPRRRLRHVSAVAVPYVAYWAPAQGSGDGAQFSAWAALGVGLPFVPALLVSQLIVTIAECRRARASGPVPKEPR